MSPNTKPPDPLTDDERRAAYYGVRVQDLARRATPVVSPRELHADPKGPSPLMPPTVQLHPDEIWEAIETWVTVLCSGSRDDVHHECRIMRKATIAGFTRDEETGLAVTRDFLFYLKHGK